MLNYIAEKMCVLYDRYQRKNGVIGTWHTKAEVKDEEVVYVLIVKRILWGAFRTSVHILMVLIPGLIRTMQNYLKLMTFAKNVKLKL